MQITKDTAAIVTGGASGLGRATATALRQAGAKVAIFDLNAEKGEAVAAEIGALFCEVNVTSEESCIAGFERARGERPRADACPLRAGIARRKNRQSQQGDWRVQAFRYRRL